MYAVRIFTEQAPDFQSGKSKGIAVSTAKSFELWTANQNLAPETLQKLCPKEVKLTALEVQTLLKRNAAVLKDRFMCVGVHAGKVVVYGFNRSSVPNEGCRRKRPVC